ncbi:MAG: penicillin-binding protein 2 [Pseudomonadota bacterium]
MSYRRFAPAPKAPPSITRRGLLLAGGQLGLIGVLGWRMRQLQVEETERYRLLAEENRINTRLIPPARGLIFDRNGTLVAENRQNYRIVIVQEQAGDAAAMLDRLGQLIPISADRRERVLADVASRASFVPVSVVEHMDWRDFARVAVNAPSLPGIIPEVGLSRHYPYGPDFAHVIGYVGPVSERDLDATPDPEPLLQIPKFQIGKSGIETRAEDVLRGEAGASRIEVNSVGRVMRELDRTDGRPGQNLQVTLDQDLQSAALDAMQGQSAAVVVMDVRSGDLLVLASAPSFDPNTFVYGISSRDWQALNGDIYRPLYNKAISGTYPPGSTFKMVVALAALEAGEVTPGDRVFCPGFTRLGNRRFHCWRRGGHGHMNLRDSLKQSCDVYYYEIARRVGVDRITEMAQRLGLGTAPDLPIPAISGGLTPTRAWKERIHDESWQVGDTFNAGIGQGYVLASPLQLAIMTARIASGNAVVPRVIRAVDDLPLARPEVASLGISERSLRQVRDGMFAVSNERRGTAYSSRIAEETMAMAGKTGTSQVRQITAAERAQGVWRNEDLPWERRDHGLFVGYAPYDDPRYAISVVVEHGGGGSSAAAPIAQRLMLRLLYGATPPLSAYPPAQRREIEERRNAAEEEQPQIEESSDEADGDRA